VSPYRWLLYSLSHNKTREKKESPKGQKTDTSEERKMTHNLIKLTPRLVQQFRYRTTLLDLVWALNKVTTDAHQTAVIAAHLINEGQVQLTGTFKGTRRING
jgi:hypothetical protein